ncbi:MAG: hypothetical protein QM535_12395, partial [Limnohabitans sp.]|nr:hypothetical protein [Limnohabitans sp.]
KLALSRFCSYLAKSLNEFKYKITDYKEVDAYKYYIEKNPLYGLNKSEITNDIVIKVGKPKPITFEELEKIDYNDSLVHSYITSGNGGSLKPYLQPEVLFKTFSDDTKKYQLNNDVIIHNKNNVILFYNSVDFDYCKYPSIDILFNGEKTYSNVEILYPYGAKESPFRIIKETNTSDVFVTYTTKKYYEKIQSKEKREKYLKDIEEDKVKQRNEIRKAEAINEI